MCHTSPVAGIRTLAITGVLTTVFVVSASAQPAASVQPANWDAGLRMVEARDDNPDPNIVEIYLTARVADVEVAPAKKVHAWTYDGGIPGPLIRTYVGNRLIVHFTNELPQPTTVSESPIVAARRSCFLDM